MSNSLAGTGFKYVGLGRRAVAFALDFLIIGSYILILLAMGLGLNAVTGGISLLASPLAIDRLAFTVLVLPVVLYFALQESSSHQATLGKRLAKIKVINAHGAKLSLWQALVRSAVKFLPWQLAHTSVIYIRFGSQSPVFLAVALVAQGLVGIYAIVLYLSKRHRTPYDWIAGSFVVLAEEAGH